MEDTERGTLFWRLFPGHLAMLMVAAVPRTYVQGLLLGLEPGQLRLLLLPGAPLLVTANGLLIAFLLRRVLIERALARIPGEPEGSRLARILQLPRALELWHLGVLTALDLLVALALLFALRRSPWLALPCTAAMGMLSAFQLIPQLLWTEQQVRGLALEEFRRAPGARLDFRGPLWRRLRWHLPYTLGLTIACGMGVCGVVIWRQGEVAVRGLLRELAAIPGGEALVWRQVTQLRQESAVALLLLGGFLVGSAVVFARQMARQIKQGADAVQGSIERMAQGIHRFPEWISTDEMGRLSAATAGALQYLGAFSGRLREVALGLGRAAAEATRVNERQDGLLARQGEILQGAQLTVQELQEAEGLAARKAEVVLGVAERVEALRRTAEDAISGVLGELELVRAQVGGMAQWIQGFGSHARQVRSIHVSIEGLAKQSRLLSLNAAVEATRVEDGNGGVAEVARQVRGLADQSVQAARRGRELLDECLGQFRSVVELAHLGLERMAVSLSQAKESGESLRQLSAIVDESVGAARRIAATLRQQGVHVEELSRAVGHLSRATAEARQQLGSPARATRHVDEVARRVMATVQAHGWDASAGGVGSGPAPVEDPGELAARLIRGQQLVMAAGLVPLLYLLILLLGLSPEKTRLVLFVFLPLFSVVSGLVIPRLISARLSAWALARIPGEPAGRRLARLLELPRRQELLYLGARVTAYAAFALLCCGLYGREYWLVLPCTLVLLLMTSFISITLLLRAEDEVRPYALRELRREPGGALPWRGPLWRGLGWYLPYVLAISLLCTLAVAAAVLWREGGEAARQLVEALPPDVGARERVRQRIQDFEVESTLIAGLLGSLLLGSAVLAARWMARHVVSGAREIQAGIEGIAAGAPHLPEWISTDEMGSLSVATVAVFQELRRLSEGLGEQAGQLGGAALELSASHAQRERFLSGQAAALGEAGGIARDIAHSSGFAAREAERVVEMTERCESVRRAGEAAVARCRSGLEGVGEQVSLMEQGIMLLDERTRELGALTAAGEEIARRSNLLALNASLQAQRSGTRGRAFSVVARELRTLAEHSGRAAQQAGEILAELNRVLAGTVATMREGAERVRGSLERMRGSSEQLLHLSALIEQSSGAASQIAAAIGQQDAGIKQASHAVEAVDRLVDETTKLLGTSAELCREVEQGAARLRGDGEETARAAASGETRAARS